MVRKLLAAVALASTLLGTSAIASAQQYGGYGYGGGYRPGPPMERARFLQGFVSDYGGYHVGLNIDGRYVNVDLHRGTVINPTGITLRPGMYVHVDGYWNGRDRFVADNINLLRRR